MTDTAIAPQTEATDIASERLEAARIRDRFPDSIHEINEFRGDTRITVRKDLIVEILTLLRDDPDLQYNFFSECLCVDYLDPTTEELILDKPHRFEVVYNLYSLPDN